MANHHIVHLKLVQHCMLIVLGLKKNFNKKNLKIYNKTGLKKKTTGKDGFSLLPFSFRLQFNPYLLQKTFSSLLFSPYVMSPG